jgi:DNA polymerase-3 subunit beta
MKFVVERDYLVDAVNWVSKSISNRPITTALLGIIIDATDEITLSGSDLESSANAKLKADISQTGKVLVPGKLLAEISRSLPAKPITFTLEGAKVLVSAGSAKFTLPTLPITEYPNLPQVPPPTGSLKSDLFATAVTQVAIAAGKDDSLPTLTGVFVEINKNQITLAATDRYRLAVRELSWSAVDPSVEATALLRARTIADAAKSLTTSSNVSISLAQPNSNEKLVGFVSDGKTMTSRVLDGSFPPTAEAVIEVAPLLDSVRRVALVTDKTVPLRLNFSNNTLQLEAGTGDEAQASEKIDINYKGEDINIAFNPTFLTDGLIALGTAFVHISFTGANKPAVLTGQNEATGEFIANYKYLLMPMRYSS